MKRCTKCQIEKPETDFWLDKRKGRRVPRCNTCSAEDRKRWKVENADRVRELERKRREAFPEKFIEAQRRYRERYPKRSAERTSAWRKANREWALQSQRDANRKLKDAAYAAYGGYLCACCGETIEAFLSLDHINNDGADHRRAVDRRKIYKWLKVNGYPEGFQVLCMNCNFGKARNGGICPHKASEGSTTMAKASTPQAIGGGSAEPPRRFICY